MIPGETGRLGFFHLVARPVYLWYLAGVLLGAWGQQNASYLLDEHLQPSYQTNGPQTVDAFLPVAGDIRERTLEVLGPGGEVVALATPLPDSEHAVTKLSEVAGKGEIELRIGSLGAFPTRILGRDDEQDLALLTLSRDLPPLSRWRAQPKSRTGELVCAPGQESRLWMGVVSAQQREIKGTAALGVSLGSPPNGMPFGAYVREVFPNTPADMGGIRPGDHVMQVEDKAIRGARDLVEIIRSCRPGRQVAIGILRSDRRIALEIPLGMDSIFHRHYLNPEINGETSERQTGFPEAIQHNIPLSAHHMGGPLVDLGGRVTGVNIARVDRITTLAIPADKVLASARAMLRQVDQ